jgi:rhamnulokinase
VIAGPAEATAAGNVLVQAMGSGLLGGLAEIRDVVKRSFPLANFEPRHSAAWDEAYAAFVRLQQSGPPAA